MQIGERGNFWLSARFRPFGKAAQAVSDLRRLDLTQIRGEVGERGLPLFRRSQCTRQVGNHRKGGVAGPPLEHADIRSVDVGSVGKLLLGDSHTLTVSPQHAAEPPL